MSSAKANVDVFGEDKNWKKLRKKMIVCKQQ